MTYRLLPIVVGLILEHCLAAAPPMVPYTKQWDVRLESLPASEVLGKLDLTRPGLAQVRAAAERGEQSRAMHELLRYYRDKYAPPAAPADREAPNLDAADGICRHVFQWGPYKAADYGPDIDWTINPADDIEWVAAVYRFYWADDLAKAYLATRDEKYARAFVELTTDWIAKHPLEDWTRTHPTLTHWKGFAWLDLQTGIRASKAVAAFKAMVHSEAVTPEFLAVFLASLHDHQLKTERIPMGMVHNKAIFEQRGVLNICHAFPEFADTSRWAKLAMERACENLLAQTTEEGVQREWCGSYHLAVLNDALDMMSKASDLGVDVPQEFNRRVRGMCDYLFATATPDLAWPMFGDTARPKPTPKDRRDASLYHELLRFSDVWKDPKYAARATQDESVLPEQKSYAFESAGVYVMRSDWGPEGVYLALHCAPPGLSGHDQPDNGTFELYAYGRWLLTDSGYYTYGHDREARAWHRQTRVHQTLTLDGRDSKIDGRLRFWQASPGLDVLVVENPSCEGLVHRRSVWFVENQFFVVLDEAVGQVAGAVRLHWTPAAGESRMPADRTSFATQFPDVNVLIRTAGRDPLPFEPEAGWFAWNYGRRQPRTMLGVQHPDGAPAAFATVIVPYRGVEPPVAEAVLAADHAAGSEQAELVVRVGDKRWRLGRSLEKKTAWCRIADASSSDARPRASADTAPPKPADQATSRPEVAVVGDVANLGSPEREDEFPAIGCDGDGAVWVCWVSFDGKSDIVQAARLGEAGKRESAPPSPVVLSQGSNDHWRPAMATDGDGHLWATWARNDAGKWDIWGSVLVEGRWSGAIRLTKGSGNSFAQKLAADADGRMWMTWQAAVDGNYEVLLAPVSRDGVGETVNVSRHPASDWEPAIATTKDGRVCVAWDSYRSGSYDILLAELKDGTLSEPIGVATSPSYEAHAALAADSQDRLWIAWDDGGPRWGQDNEEERRLHSQRSVEVRCLQGDRLYEAAEPLSDVLTGPLAAFCELPDLIADGDGRIWLVVRHLTDLTPPPRPNGRRSQARGIWNPYVLCYDGKGWSQPRPLPESNGRNDMRVRTCIDGGGRVWAAWADDGRRPERAEEPQTHNVHAARLASGGPIRPFELGRSSAPASLGPIAAASRSEPPRHRLAAKGKEYLLLYGDTHRHTDLSRCGMNFDGSLMDTYRYAIDAARLDFLAISDHDQDLLKHRYDRQASRLQHYGWWRSEKYCDLFHIEHRFVPIYAYEHGGSFAARGGHKNVLYLERGRPCYEMDSPEELFKALEGKNAIAIPHQLADGPSATDWSRWDSRFERVAEIYQARGSYEFKGASPPVSVTRDGHYMWDALKMGVRIGIIASSDHGMVHNAYAGVYASELSRAGVMEGLASRRTFGSMDRMVIEFRMDGSLMGEELRVDRPPAFSVLIDAPHELRKVQVVRNGEMIHTVAPEGRNCRFEFTDEELRPGGEAWYYVRCEQGNDKYGWSSPIWIRRTPEEPSR